MKKKTETIGGVLRFFIDAEPDPMIIRWPPDAFACAALLLEKSGAYLAALSGELSPAIKSNISWQKHAKQLGDKWRTSAMLGKNPPRQITALWKRILSALHQPLSCIAQKRGTDIRNTLMEILAAADEACAGAGIWDDFLDQFDSQCIQHLVAQLETKAPSTLCKEIPADKLCVLPKMHTPQFGITIRSLSHNLSLLLASEVRPIWQPLIAGDLPRERHGLNVLVVPWPLQISPAAFSESPDKPLNADHSRFRHFDYNGASRGPFDIQKLEKLVNQARQETGSVDIIILPELALRSSDFKKISKLVSKMTPRPIVIAGISKPGPSSDDKPLNSCMTIVPVQGSQSVFYQHKHHRWLMDGNQVRQYGLGGVLDPTIDWWENMHLSPRELRFVSCYPWLTFSNLICEDLARPDPVTTLLRAVGPNLVFALLMDGPQLASRWPARYATVLADDPGSSVLTVSSLGMVKLSRPPGKPESRIVALWKDARSGAPLEIELPHDHQAILLSLSHEMRNEVTADGRNDGGAASYLSLSGIHPIKIGHKP
ncbi:MAG TPA: hypothetical protein VG733_09615 [Chthoniobacteraceae bacterium]|nr:hypothetical protein [Chthoniobacteraceae bacterium]